MAKETYHFKGPTTCSHPIPSTAAPFSPQLIFCISAGWPDFFAASLNHHDIGLFLHPWLEESIFFPRTLSLVIDCVCACVYVYICIYVYVYMCIFVCVYVCTNKCECIKRAKYCLVIHDKNLFCRISSLLQGSFAKETCNFKEPTHLSCPISKEPTIVL